MTFYFTFFGFLIFYITSIVHLTIAQNHLANAATRLVQHQIALIPGSDQSQFWWNTIDQKQPELRALAELLLSLTHTGHKVIDISIYTMTEPDRTWHRLSLDSEDYLREAPADKKLFRELNSGKGGMIDSAGSDFYISPRKMALLVKLTGTGDEGKVFIGVDILREGITAVFLSRWVYWVIISPLALIVIRIISYLFARALSKPVEVLSKAAEKVAKGDFSVQVPSMGKTELGALGNNFNKMIQGLREWQRIKAIEMELEKGRAIQQDFLPTHIPCPPHWDIATCFHPAREVSGDFYDVFDLPGGNVGLVIADVCDKGVGSALYMALIRSLIRVYAEQALYPENNNKTRAAKANAADADTDGSDAARGLSAVNKTNAYLAKNHSKEGMFATLFFGILKPETGQLVYHNCGHEPLYIVGCDGLKAELPPTGPAVGIMEDVDYEIGTLYIGPGELLLGLTDGVTEARNLANELFTRQRLKDLLTQPAKSANGLLEQIRQQVFAFVGTAPESDDVTMLAVQRLV